ncbi:MAG: CDP-diacylglycerol--serine O-phosphatidyltransferase [Sphaerobacteraceae bacterium]|nr:MAG: CDP-diacylglycerol--serine O-phosphatidyltransferase [Sphaerobacteraceae bacterium]
MLTLSCGLAAIESARTGNWDWALRFILLATIADGLDGALARQLDATSDMGEQLDSLADIVAFGAAPAVLFVTVFTSAPTPVIYSVGLFFVLAGAYRLARFHAVPADGVFLGLPITAGGALLALIAAGPFGLNYWLATILAVSTAALMVSRVPFPKMSGVKPNPIGMMAVGALPIVMWPTIETLAIVAALIMLAYIIWGLIRRIDMEEDASIVAEEEEYDWANEFGFEEEEYEPSQQPR